MVFYDIKIEKKARESSSVMLEYDTGEQCVMRDTILHDQNAELKCVFPPDLYNVLCCDKTENELCPKENCAIMNIEDTMLCLTDEVLENNEEHSPFPSVLGTNISAEKVNYNTASPVTHIEIIKSGSRRVTGANRVVPLLTSALKAGKQTPGDSSLGEVYKNFLSDLDNSDNNKRCIICFEVLLSCTELEYHVKNVHAVDVIVDQCFVCRRKYIFQDQLQCHLNHIHSISSPDLICKICFMEFGTTMEQKAHERKHDQTHVCHMCAKKFSTEYLYQRHLNQHIFAVIPNECRICGKRFNSSSALEIHEKRHANIKCIICGIHFDNDVGFLFHAKRHKTDDVIKLLKHVEQKDQEEIHLEEMLALYTKLTSRNKINNDRVHENSVPDTSVLECVTTMVSTVSQINDGCVVRKEGRECKLCGMNVSTEKELLDHRKKFHLRSRTCPFCGKRNKSVSLTWRHMNSHHLKNKVNFRKMNSSAKHIASDLGCIEGDNEITSYPKNKQTHKNSRLYSCHICSRKFLYPGSRDSHVLQHSTDKCDSWKCMLCGQMFSHPGLLLTHTSVHEPTMKCQICDKLFLSQNALQLHIKTHFDGDEKKMFKCNICSIECPSLAGLQTHHRCHTGERPYVCGQCNGKFKRRQALKKHVQVVHNSASLQYHSCSECPRRFNSSGNLIRHYVRIHCHVRRFICGICGSRFSQNQDLRKHFKVLHRVEMPNINGSDRKALREIYVIPDIDDLSETHPHAVKIRTIVAEEKAKFSRLSELLVSKGENGKNTSLLGDVLQKKTCIEYQEKTFHDEQSNFKKTYFTNSNEYIKLYSCEYCRKTFSGVSEYMEHVAEGSKSFMCKQCGYNFCNQMLLDNHIENEHDMHCNTEVNDISNEGNCLQDAQNTNSAHVMQYLSSASQEIQSETSHAEQNSSLLKQSRQQDVAVLTNSVKDTSTLSSGIGTAELSKHMLPMESYVGGVVSNNIPTTVNINGIILQNVLIHPSSTMLPSVPVGFQNQEVLNATCVTPIVTFNSNLYVDSHTSSSSSYNINDVQNMAVLRDLDTNDLPCVSKGVQQSILQMNSHPNLKNEIISSICVSEASEKCGDIQNIDDSKKQGELFNDRSDSFNVDCKKSGILDDCKKTSCRYCGEKFYNTASLNRHMKCHADTKSGVAKSYGCPDCGKQFSEKHNLKVHLMTHTGERPYKCEDCGKQLRYRKDLIDHKRMHLGEKPFTCNECDRKFIRRRELIRHKLIHTGEKRHKCPICGKMFGRLDQLRYAHLLTHANSTPQARHTCSICKKSFRLKSKLKQHEVLHSGLKKHKCELCHKSFALEVYLKTHMQCHKKRDTYLQCPKCPRQFISGATLQIHEQTFHERLKKSRKRDKISEEIASGEDSTLYSGNIEIDGELGADIEIHDVDFSVLEANNCNAVIYFQMEPENNIEIDS